jgi:polyhydroxyalkanoate synthesis regulator phasin
MQMFLCIQNAPISIALPKSDCTVGEQNPQVSGPSLLKVVIRKSHVDTNATTSHILMKLTHINKIVRESNSDIIQVNEKVQALVDELAARGETMMHLGNHLFEGYKATSDKQFVQYIKRKQQEYNKGTTAIEPDSLMYLAAKFYTSSIESEEWEKSSPQEEQIIALEAQVKTLEANATNFSNEASKTPRPSNNSNRTRNANPVSQPRRW